MNEEYLNNKNLENIILEKYTKDYDKYNVYKNNVYKEYDYLKDYFTDKIIKKSHFSPPAPELTDEEKLDRMDIHVVERWLRKKKLANIPKEDE